MDIKVDNALTAKEAKELSNSAVAAYAEQWLPEILAEIFAQIRLAAKNEKTYINNMNVFAEYHNREYLYACIKTFLEGMGYVVSMNETDYKIHVSWYNAE